MSFMISRWRFTPLTLAALLCACGGGSGDNASTPVAQPAPPAPPAPTPTLPAPAPVPVPVPVPAPDPLPVLSSSKTMLDGSPVGTDTWSPGSTVGGGRGATTAGVTCVNSEAYHIHAHLTIINDGKQLAIPANVGLQGCTYELHTHDTSGIIHVETAVYKKFTVGQLFGVWGYPLTDVNVAGISGKKVTAFIVDGDTLTRHSGKLDDIELIAHRDVVLVLGAVPAQLPAYQWKPGI